MIHPGLVSVTFRRLAPEEIVKLAARTGLRGIEWGGDIHVPHGDLKRAAEVAAMTGDAGLEVASYGSYYRPGGEGTPEMPAVLDTALALGAKTVRIWAGALGSADASEGDRRRISDACRAAVEAAGRAGVAVACEYHGNTLTDSLDSTLRLLRECPGLMSYWQPPVGCGEEAGSAAIGALSPRLGHVHVFHWSGSARLPLERGRARWARWFREIEKAPGDRFALLEFVRDDAPEQLAADAKTLAELLGEQR